MTLFALAALSATPSFAAYHETNGPAGYMPYVASIHATTSGGRIQGIGSPTVTNYADGDVSYERSYTWTQEYPTEPEVVPAFQIMAQVNFDGTSVGIYPNSTAGQANVSLTGLMERLGVGPNPKPTIHKVETATADTTPALNFPTTIYAHSKVLTMSIPAGWYAFNSPLIVGATHNVSANSFVNVTTTNGSGYANEGNVSIGSPWISIAP